MPARVLCGARREEEFAGITFIGMELSLKRTVSTSSVVETNMLFTRQGKGKKAVESRTKSRPSCALECKGIKPSKLIQRLTVKH